MTLTSCIIFSRIRTTAHYAARLVTKQSKNETVSRTSWGIFVKPHEYGRLNLHTCYTAAFVAWLIAGVTVARFPYVTLIAAQCGCCHHKQFNNVDKVWKTAQPM